MATTYYRTATELATRRPVARRSLPERKVSYAISTQSNDIVDTTTGSPEVLGHKIAKNLADSEAMLRKAGARNFVIPDLFRLRRL